MSLLRSSLVALALGACGPNVPESVEPEAPKRPPPDRPTTIASGDPAVIASAGPDAGPSAPDAEARKRRALDLLQGKVPASELKVDSVGE